MKNGRLLDDSFKFARLDSIKLILRIPLKMFFFISSGIERRPSEFNEIDY